MALKVARCDHVQCDDNDVQCDGSTVVAQCDDNNVTVTMCNVTVYMQSDGIHSGMSVHLGVCSCDCTAALE